MANKRFWLGMLVMMLAFGMTVVGCDTGNGNGSGNDNGSKISIPSAPTGVKATASTTGKAIYLDWNSVPGASAYKVYKAESSPNRNFSLAYTIQQSGNRSYHINDGFYSYVPAGLTYYYYVVAVNSAGESPKSSVVSATLLK
jgi:fibronectin type 3 domain-containing protein